MALDGTDAATIEAFDIPTAGAILYGLAPTTAILTRTLLN